MEDMTSIVEIAWTCALFRAANIFFLLLSFKLYFLVDTFESLSLPNSSSFWGLVEFWFNLIILKELMADRIDIIDRLLS